MKESGYKGLKNIKIILIIAAGFTLIFNLLGLLPAFANFYTLYIFKYITLPQSFICNLFDFAIGEILMYTAVLFLIVFIGLSVFILLFRILKKTVSKKMSQIYRLYSKTLTAVLLITFVIYSLNWSVPYHSSFLKLPAHRAYSFEELAALRNFLVSNLNETARAVPRDSGGNVIYHNNPNDAVIASMKKLANTYPLLSGYYPDIKAAFCSDYLDYMRIGGYTYPYTMEVTYNRFVIDIYKPVLFAHEMAHHKGFYKEDEASFISYLACVNSDDDLLRYSALYEAVSYVNDEFTEAICSAYEGEEALKVYYSYIQIDSLVIDDINLCVEQYKENLDNQTSETSKKLKSTVEKVGDAGWKAQAKVIGDNDYDGLVDLLLRYYEGGLY